MKTLGFYDDANLRLDVSSLTEIQYLLIEKSEQETHTTENCLICLICTDSSDEQSAVDGL